MASTEVTPRYRNFSTNMPLPTNTTPRAGSTLITVEKEPERNPEEDCFMCRQAHVYIKPIGMHQERRVARRHPPPLTRAQMDELSQKKHLTKQEAKKLLQCYFPEIKDVKYFQLHKYHSCCYDPKHLNLCKNHITALQHERDQHPNHHHHDQKTGEGHDDNYYKDYEREGGLPNRVSFVRIKIEPTKGIPTRFLGPTALPESLADMLIKQVNRLEDKKTTPTMNTSYTSQPYQVRRLNYAYTTDDDDDDNDDEHVESQTQTGDADLVVEDLDELNRLRLNDQQHTLSKPLKRKKRKKVTKKKTASGEGKPKLKHWEIMALEQVQQDSCNCRHQVLRLEGDKVVYDWCRCKDNQHKELMERRQSIDLTPTPPPEESRRPSPPPPSPPPPPPPAPRAPPKAKPRQVRKRSIGVDAMEQNTTELALAYDPSAVDYDMIQEVIYYRTSSGRLIKPEVTNAFTYDTIPPAITTMTINPGDPNPRRAEVLYMAPNGQLRQYENSGPHPERTNRHPAAGKNVVLSYPGSVYNGQAYVTTENSPPHTRDSDTMPVLRLPQSLQASRQYSRNNGNTEYQPAEFTLARFSSGKNINTPASRRSTISGSQQTQQTPPSDSRGRGKIVSKATQKSSKPTYSNLEPTPNYGRESSVVVNRRWFDQPLGDQNLRPVHDGQYGLIAGASTGQYHAKSQLPTIDHNSPTMRKNESNCTIS